MGKKYNFDYCIIGSGPAGTAAALTLASKQKTKVAIIEDHAFGGSNLNTRDVPYSICLNFSHTFARLKSFPEINGQELHFNFPSVLAHQNQTISALGGGSTDVYEAAGVISMFSHAHFLDAHTVALGNDQITAENFIIATGSKLKPGDIVGLDDVPYLTPETAIKLRKLPKYALVIGGGATGCEVASYFAELGTSVFMIEAADRLLPKEDPEVGMAIQDYFSTKLGIKIAIGTRVVALERDSISKKIVFTTGGQEKSVRIDCVILATGSEPALDLGLENAGVKYTRDGIVVNKMFQTSAKNIYAVGDCLGGDSSTEKSEYQATVLANNLLNKGRTYANYRGLTRVVNTYPEVATVGMTESELRKTKTRYKKAMVEIKNFPASRIQKIDTGFVKVMTSNTGKILGASIVTPEASLLITEIALAMRSNTSIVDVADLPHIANGFATAIKEVAEKLSR